MTARTSPVEFRILHVNCRHCGTDIPVSIDPAVSPAEALAECERQAKNAHTCPLQPQEPS